MEFKCPDDDEAVALMKGLTTAERIDLWSRHLEECQACQLRLERLDALNVLDIHMEKLPAHDQGILQRIVAEHPRNSDALVDIPFFVPGFDIEELIGKGGQASVYRARQSKLQNRLVALKVLGHGAFPLHRSDFARFRAEAHAYCKLNHPNIVQLFDVGDSQGLPYLVLEYVEGGTLRELLDSQRHTPQQAARLVQTICLAVQHAHDQGVLHRDLKPNNILMVGDVCKVSDFGLARISEAELGITHSSQPIGSIEYASPEQALGKHELVSAASDVYSLGAILYEILVGRPPFLADDWGALIDQIKREEPVSPRALRPGLPRELDTICLKCLQKEPVNRYVSPRALADDLTAYLSSKPIMAKPAGVLERTWKFARRHTALVTAFAAALIGVLVTSLFLVAMIRSNLRQEQTRAELVKQDALARFQNGLAFSRQGIWNSAISAIQSAAEHDHELVGPAQLELTQIYLHLGRQREAQQAFEVADRLLGQTPQVELARATLVESHDAELSIAAAQRALDSGKLSWEDAEFARALKATSYGEVLTRLQGVLKVKPAHLSAARMYLGLLATLGRFDEAEEQIQRMQVLLPQDKSYMFVRALKHAAKGDKAAAMEQLDQLTATLEPSAGQIMRELLLQVASVRQATAGRSRQLTTLELVSVLSQFAYSFAKVKELGKRQDAGLALPPGLRIAYSTFFKQSSSTLSQWMGLVFGGQAATHQLLENLTKIQGDGATYYLLGCSWLGENNLVKAQEAFEAGYQSSSLFDFKSKNCLMIALCLFKRIKAEPPPEEQAALNAKMDKILAAALAFPDYNAEDYYFLGQFAFQTTHIEETRGIAKRWRQLETDSKGPFLYMAYADFMEKRWLAMLEELQGAQRAPITPSFFASQGQDVDDEVKKLTEAGIAKLQEQGFGSYFLGGEK